MSGCPKVPIGPQVFPFSSPPVKLVVEFYLNSTPASPFVDFSGWGPVLTIYSSMGYLLGPVHWDRFWDHFLDKCDRCRS
jgi:hypothetical protein